MSLSHLFPRAALAACLSLLALAPSAHAEDAERLRVHGSNTLGSQLMPALVEGWLHSAGYDHLQRVAVNGSLLEIHALRDGEPLIVEIGKQGSAAGMHDLITGDAELAMLARAPSETERRAGWQLGDLDSPDQQFVIALNGARVLVAAHNPLQSLDLSQLDAVLTGRIDNWKQLGGSDLPIHLHCVASGGLQDFLRTRVTGGGALRGCTTSHRTAHDVARAVAGDPQALGVVELATPEGAGSRAVAISEGGIALAPSPVNLRSEDYPLVQRYSVYGGQMMSALGRSLALYLIGPQAQRIVAAQGLLALQLPTPISVAMDGEPAAYREAVGSAKRLPLSVHFNLQSLTTMFAGTSAQELERLVRFMQLPANRGRHLAVIGFANPDNANKLFPTIDSNDRADIIAGYLAQQGITVQRARGLGALRPLVDPHTADARRRNERVEIWLL